MTDSNKSPSGHRTCVAGPDLNGDLLAFDAATGKLLHKIATQQPAGGGVITYQAGGKQRIAMATGMENRIFGTHGQPVVMVFGL
jgi:alcohol dehydrogenase (cytochrome c)